MEQDGRRKREKKEKNWFKEMCVCWGVHMYTDSNSLDPSSRVIWGPFISCLPLFCACFFFLSLFFTILVLRLCVFGWSILVLRTLQEPEGFYVYIGLVWRLEKIRSSFSSSPSEKTIKKEDPKKNWKERRRRKRVDWKSNYKREDQLNSRVHTLAVEWRASFAELVS